MPSFTHELLVELLRHRSEPIRELLRACAGLELGDVVGAPASADLSQIAATEYRADGVIVFRDRAGRADFAVVLEVQLRIDADKLRTWPMYVTAARSKLDCPTMLLVIAPDAAVARWAHRPIALDRVGSYLRPVVIAYADVPRIRDPAIAQRIPELAVLSALVHPSLEAAQAAMLGLQELLDEGQARLYFDLVMQALPEQVRTLLEAQMEGYEYQSDFARKYIKIGRDAGREEGEAKGREAGREEGVAKGREEGEAKGRAQLQAAALQLARRKVASLSEEDAEAIAALTDAAALTELIVALGQAAGEAEARAALGACRIGPL